MSSKSSNSKIMKTKIATAVIVAPVIVEETAQVIVATPSEAQTVSTVYIVDSEGTLRTASLKAFAEVQKDTKLLSSLIVLKHNPTNVHGSGLARRSDEARRPLYLLQDGMMFKQDMIETPVKAQRTNSGGKTVRVASGGPRTFYVVGAVGDNRLFSLNPEQFDALSKDLTGLKYLAKLKHLPTCVEMSLTQGLISNDLARPIYRVLDGKLVKDPTGVEAVEAVEAVAVVEDVVESKKPLTKREMAAKKLQAKADSIMVTELAQ